MRTSTMAADACVARLCELGFRIGLTQTGIGMTLLRKGDRRVIVPHVTIEPPMLLAILRSAGVSEAEFFGTSRSGIFPKTDVPIDYGTRKNGR